MRKNVLFWVKNLASVIVIVMLITCVLHFSFVFGDNNYEENYVENYETQDTGLYLSEPSFKYVKARSNLNVRGGASSQAEVWDSLPYGAMVVASSEVVNGYTLIIYTKGTTDYSGYVYNDYLTSEEITQEMIESNQASYIPVASTNNMTYLGTYYATGYDTCARCCGKSDSITASGRRATVGRTVAMSGIAFGQQVYIEGIGYRIVEDRGVGPGKIDILVNNHSEAYAITGYYDVYLVN